MRHALRSVLGRPATSAIVLVTLALGLGANAAVFSIVDALVLRPFTLRGVDRIAMLAYSKAGDIDRQESVSPADFLDFKRQMDVFDHLAAFQWWNANLVGRDEPEAVQGFQVSSNFFDLIGVPPASGRGFLAEEETIGRHRRVVLGHGLWQRRFAGDASLVGQTVQIDGAQYEVVGIAPKGFDFPLGSELWAPLAFSPKDAADRRSLYLTVVGRLANGRTLQDAKTQAAVIGTRLEREHPETNRGRESRVYTLAQGMLDIGLGPILSLWQASALVVLLIACANVANLLLARGAERQREIAVRLAIGAGRGRVVREQMLESAILALAAVPVALVVAWASLKVLVAGLPAKLIRFVPGWETIDVDGRLVAVTVLLALGTAFVFGLVPALQITRPRLSEALRDGGRGSTAGVGRSRLRRGLVVAELALALPLLVASALSAVSVQRFLNGPQGYNPDGALTMQVVLGDAQYPDADARRRFAMRVVEKLQAIPGVQHAAAINIIPGIGGNSIRSIEIEGQPNSDPANPPTVDYRTCTPDIFSALQIPISSGRGFTAADREGSQPVAIVSEALARRYWPGARPIGHRIRTGTGEWMTVVGVSGDIIHNWFGRRFAPTLYTPLAQAPPGSLSFVMRTAGDPAALSADARAALRDIDPTQPLIDLQTLRSLLYVRTVGLRYVAGMMGAFGALALVLAIVGVYGVMAYMVTQRTHEIGLRIALGATRGSVLRLTARHTMVLAGIGVGLGIALSIAVGRVIESVLAGAASSDLRITAALAVLLITTALAASYLPARRAASIDPMVALRAE